MPAVLNTLKKYFGYDAFRPSQREVIDTILSGRDVLAVMPTGSGKSICYQIPALLSSGITIVISPLISLMRDQVTALCNMGVRAAYLNSTLTYGQCKAVLKNAAMGVYKVIYVAPERLSTSSFGFFAAHADISLIAIDESHCVSEWGHDFRRSYLEIKNFIASLAKRPTVAAFTATATEQVKADIVRLLELEEPKIFTTGYDRPNLYFGISNTSDKLKYIIDFIKRRPESSGIIYCMTRKNTEALCDALNDNGIDALKYHAGLTEKERNENQDDFVYDRCHVIVATNAFGMGIDKSNVSFVIHYNMPMSIESYYQEAGRAGRDGLKAECVLLFSERDVKLGEFIIEQTTGEQNDELDEAEISKLKKINLRKLENMAAICRSSTCVRANILSYFKESYKDKSCENCSVCLKKNKEVTLNSAKIIIGTAIMKTGGRYGAVAISDLLAGKKNQKLIGRGYDKLYEFGQLKLADQRKIRGLIDTMVDEGLLEKSAGQYSVLNVTEKFIKLYSEMPKMPSKTEVFERVAERRIAPDEALFNALKAWRKETAYKIGVPPYVVFNDMTLSHIAALKPKSYDELLKIKGIAKQKADKYSTQVLRIVDKYRK